MVTLFIFFLTICINRENNLRRSSVESFRITTNIQRITDYFDLKGWLTVRVVQVEHKPAHYKHSLI